MSSNLIALPQQIMHMNIDKSDSVLPHPHQHAPRHPESYPHSSVQYQHHSLSYKAVIIYQTHYLDKVTGIQDQPKPKLQNVIDSGCRDTKEPLW